MLSLGNAELVAVPEAEAAAPATSVADEDPVVAAPDALDAPEALVVFVPVVVPVLAIAAAWNASNDLAAVGLTANTIPFSQ